LVLVWVSGSEWGWEWASALGSAWELALVSVSEWESELGQCWDLKKSTLLRGLRK
jgi:hypothetical protein